MKRRVTKLDGNPFEKEEEDNIEKAFRNDLNKV